MSYTTVISCGFPIDTQVKINSLSKAFNFKSFTGFSLDITGIISGFKIGSPISTLTVSTFLSMGNPHAITVVKDTEKFDVETYGRILEVDKAFPNKTNVEFVQIVDKEHIKMRVWERGAGETLACGTGACATAVACHLNGLTDRNVYIELLRRNIKNRME